jgi:lysophospholipase L1-like esterase
MPTINRLQPALRTWRTGGLLAVVCVCSGSIFAADAPSAMTVALIGDSTVSTYDPRPADKPELTGWGQVLGERFTERVTVKNHAASGRSTKSFRAEKRWEPVLALKPQYVLIQFGHNDQKAGPRYADPEVSFREELRRYISEARAVGATPILVTPVARRTFAESQPTTSLGPYAEAMQVVGREEKVAVLDLHKVSVELYGKLGDEGSADMTIGPNDRTHFTKKGARVMAGLVAELIRKEVPELRPYLRPAE